MQVAGPHRRTNLVVADQRAQRGPESLVLDLLGDCFPSLRGGSCRLVVGLCRVRAIGGRAAVLQRRLGRHAGLRACGPGVVEMLEGGRESSTLLAQSEVAADECNWRLCLRPGCVCVQEGGVAPALGSTGASGWVSPTCLAIGKHWVAASVRSKGVRRRRASAIAHSRRGFEVVRRGSGVWIPDMLKGDRQAQRIPLSWQRRSHDNCVLCIQTQQWTRSEESCSSKTPQCRGNSGQVSRKLAICCTRGER
jgi:hypothetical protein